MGWLDIRKEAEVRDRSVRTEPRDRAIVKVQAAPPVIADRLSGDTPKAGLFSRLLDGGFSAAQHAMGGLQVAQGAIASLRHSTLNKVVVTERSVTPAEHQAPFIETRPAVNQDRETAPSTHGGVHLTLFQINVTNEKGPGIVSQAVNSMAGAAASFASARHAQGEAKTDPASASSLSATALRFAFGAAKTGAAAIAKRFIP